MIEFKKILDRSDSYFSEDFADNIAEMKREVSGSTVLVMGAGGSIGQTITKQLFSLRPKRLIAVDLSENSLVELVRDIRSSLGYLDVDFKTLAIDCGSAEFQSMIKSEKTIDFVFNLSALKHVRSERDPYTLMRLLKTNVLDVLNSLAAFENLNVQRYFAVSTDKAANPVNMMGASKLLMEKFLFSSSWSFDVTTARFANVAFSAGSLLEGFKYRIEKCQPLSAPSDIERYFISHKEAGNLSLIAGLLGKDGHTYYPNISSLEPTNFAKIAENYVKYLGYKPRFFTSEDEARAFNAFDGKEWPIYVFETETTGEKPLEEFYTSTDERISTGYSEIGAIRNKIEDRSIELTTFINSLSEMRTRGFWEKRDLVELVRSCLKEFNHLDTGIYLDDKM